ncbi:orotate phosphoribosyltransferase [Pseudalkalibacillus salsuginis]|uniref:orotate phosphoribosyltransferase n=1 Tax=Pseudalkalibacillus salsuginis TaxID=2910972 RepID=UPI001F3826C3|nr:orotate phosphoribosyltransferase [Pseudalkalibacillus salsuginis]MCF6410504.1 orotate phosphoribosyltransferase [Pseudalkalibacillus salsuginis]
MKRQVAKYLLDIEAVTLRPDNPYTWSSGLKAPIYCDNRLIISHPEIRSKIADSFVALIEKHFPNVEAIAGTATAGIPHAALVADRMNLPMVYVRSKAKAHGKGKQIEGRLSAETKVVVIEDLISTGGSVLNAVEALKDGGATILGCAAIFTYELQKGKEAFTEISLNVHTLSDFNTLVDVAAEEGKISNDSISELNDWCKDPESWSNVAFK